MSALRTQKNKHLELGDECDERSLASRAGRYLDWLEVKSFSKATIASRRIVLVKFIIWCRERDIESAADITAPMLDRYQRHLFYQRRKGDGSLSVDTQCFYLGILKSFFRWLCKHHFILHNPSADIEMPKRALRLPRVILSPDEVEAVMREVDLSTPAGLRDRAILETFYSTGIRRTELMRLSVQDIDPKRGTLLVRSGKGKKDRMVPIGERALLWIDKYVKDARPELSREPDDGVLFVREGGRHFYGNRMSELARIYIEKAALGKSAACHVFRHSMATHMLEGGADLRFIQAILGHAKVTSTEIYTHVSIAKLKEVHEKTHPAARLKSTDGDEKNSIP